uniref:RNase H type-1 domain-containing protein n=1 Tax=Chenopodium quinoa TaxID=63459 RepID=A0A803MYZ7_CHEQI
MTQSAGTLRRGDYFVRSAYRESFGDSRWDEASPSSAAAQFWTRVWSSNTLPRVKIFFWKAVKGALPTLVGFGKRLPGRVTTCSLCGAAEETEKCFERSPSNEPALFRTVCWEIWSARNKWIFEGTRCEPKRSMEYVSKLLIELQGDEQPKVLMGGGSKQRWKLPNSGWVKVNVDRGVSEGLGASAGAMIRDSGGGALLAAAWRTEERWQPCIAEAKAIYLGIKVAIEAGYSRVRLESDCLAIIDAIVARERGRSSLHLILDDNYHVFSFLRSVSWSFIHREGNKVAHGLAHCLPWEIGSSVWLSDFPACIVSLLNKDLPMNES